MSWVTGRILSAVTVSTRGIKFRGLMEWKKPGSGSKYGLQLKIASPANKKPQLKKPVPFVVNDNNTNDEYSVEDDIARHASKKQYAREVELQHKQALEEDASAFDYDGVYDEMKGKQAQPIREDRAKREPKYIGKLLQHAKLRTVEHDIAYERNLAKERAKEDYLYPDKEKFVTKAYKQKLIEQGKWLEEERLREIKEQADEVTKKADMGDFYRNLLSRNVAYGATKEIEAKKSGNSLSEGGTSAETAELATSTLIASTDKVIASEARDREEQRERNHRSSDGSVHVGSSQLVKRADTDAGGFEGTDKVVATGTSVSSPHRVEDSAEQKDAQIPSATGVVRKTKEEAVQAARERYLARKKQRNS